MSRLINLFAIPDNPGSGSVQTKPLTVDDTITLFGEDDEDDAKLDLDDESKKITEEDSSGEDNDKDTGDSDKETDDAEEVDELKELEEELEDVDEEKLELTTPVRRREILKKYPTLFKDFPYLEKAYYREQQFTELLPTINDAKEAVAKSSLLDKFEKDLNDGHTETILKSVKAASQESFTKLVDDLLPTLARVDENAYYHVLGNVIKQTIVNMAREGKTPGNEVLANAAVILNQFVFGSSEFEAPKPLSTGKSRDNEAENKLLQEKQNFERQKYESARDDLTTRIDNTLRATIDSNIDPKSSMTDYIKRNAVRDANEKLEKLIQTDTRFKVILTKLWQKAANDGFSQRSKDEIKSAYLTRAKTLLPAVLKSARNEALKGMGKRAKDEDSDSEVVNSSSKKGPIASGKSTTSSNSGKSPSERAKQIPAGMSTRDWLMADD
jgi:hypothetical protein